MLLSQVERYRIFFCFVSCLACLSLIPALTPFLSPLTACILTTSSTREDPCGCSAAGRERRASRLRIFGEERLLDRRKKTSVKKNFIEPSESRTPRLGTCARGTRFTRSSRTRSIKKHHHGGKSGAPNASGRFLHLRVSSMQWRFVAQSPQKTGTR